MAKEFTGAQVERALGRVKTELDKKIIKPSDNGTSGQILRTDGAGGTSWENPATEEEIATATDAWLQQNITNPSNPPLDRSLSLETAAAPADMVGGLESALNSQVITVEGKNKINPKTIIVGRINSDGSVQELSSYRTSDYILLEPSIYALGRVDISTGEVLAPDYFGYALYDLNKTYIADSRVYQQYTEAITLTVTIQEKCYIRVTGNRNYFENKNGIAEGYYMLCKGSQLEDWKAYVDTELYGALFPAPLNNVLIAVPGKNLYDKNTCVPANGYFYNSVNGQYAANDNNAVTGKIPVKDNTTYTFSAGSASVIRINYFKGDGGNVHMSSETNPTTFTTPEGCTYIGFTLFNGSHTTEDYNSAINVAQLELGNAATEYEPYKIKRVYSMPAASDDIGKALVVKRVVDGKVVDWEFKSTSGDVDKTLKVSDVPADSKVVGDTFDEIAPIHLSKNLYNAAACNPQNGKQYNNYGEPIDSEKYAVTGKIPIEPNTQYVFSIGGIGKVKSAYYYSGTTGDTFVSVKVLDNAAFTTPATATFVGLTLFAATHTQEKYEAAIAVAQLEKGPVSTEYVPYSETRKVETSALVAKDAVEGAVNVITSASLINQFNKALCEDGKYFNTNSYEILDNTNYGFSGLIPVKPNTQYNISCDKTLAVGKMATYYQEWDATKTFIQIVQQNYAFSYISQIQTDANTHYISLNLQFGAAHTTEQFNALIDSIMLVEGMQIPSEYVPYKLESVINHTKSDNVYFANQVDKWRGKKWLVCGTSISYQDSHVFTEGIREGEVCRGYIGNVSRNKPMLITNEGISGSTLAKTDQTTALINRYQNLNFGDYDFISLEYGVNDFGNNVPVGTANDQPGTDTFAACLKTIIEYAIAQNPIVGLIICTEPDVRGVTTNSNGNTLKDFTDVTIAIAQQYRLPICDWYYRSGINTLNKGDGTREDTMTQAGTHPSNYGHMRMGAMLNQVFDSLLC